MELPPLTVDEALEKARRLLEQPDVTFDSATARRIFAGLLRAKQAERERLTAFFARNIHSAHFNRIVQHIPPEL